MPLQFDLDTRPAILPLYFRALTARKPGRLPPGQERVLASVLLGNQAVDPVHLQIYRDVCGFGPGQHLPATYPFVLAMPLQLKLLVSEAFPFPVLGVVHVRNSITQYRPLLEREHLDIRCDLAAAVAVKRGYEFELLTSVRVNGELVWECVSTLLSRTPHGEAKVSRPSSGKKAWVAPVDEGCASAVNWQVPADIGRRYARVSGDRNPIHLSASTAKIFGFPRAIAHGMWTKARCLAALEEGAYAGTLPDRFTLGVDFIKPIFLPAEVLFQSAQSATGTGFSLSSGGRRVNLTGALVHC
ncbi:MaoC family dehydratase [Microbulbifer harenosus]|nr:MaoC/PaaZ C-terminal domain-containing protein [Microbulbifer harenosus]